MKISITYLLLSLLLLTSCSNEIEIGPEPHPTNEVPVPIEILPKWIEATKTTIESFTASNAVQIGIMGTSGTDIIYQGISPSGIDETTQHLLFKNPPLVYPTNNHSVTLTGYYPTLSNNGTSYTLDDSGLLHFTLTGDEDLMYAPSVEAGNKSNPTPVHLNFVHKLTCIKFKLINEITGDLPDGLITLSTTGPSSGTLDLHSGTLTANGLQSTFTLPTPLNASTLAKSTETEVKGELLLIPSTAAMPQDYAFKLSINNIDYTIQIDNTNKPEWKEGMSYTLTITIKGLTPSTKGDGRRTSFNKTGIQGTIA